MDGIIELDDEVAAAAVDDVLHLRPVVVHRRDLIFAHDHDLFGLGLGVTLRLLLVAVARGDEQQTDLGKIALTEISDVPAEHIVADLIAFMSLRRPVLRRPECKRRQGDFSFL